jgi:hypothetical protein
MISRRIFPLTCGAAFLAALPVAVALAAQPTKGAIYDGAVAGRGAEAQSCSAPVKEKGRGGGSNGGGSLVCFEVSRNGKSLSDFQGPYVQACANIGVASLSYQTHAKISGGRFVVKLMAPAHSKNSIVITGQFVAHGGVRGKIRVATQCLRPPNFNSGPVKHETLSWSGTSEPDGKASAFCFDDVRKHGSYVNIVEIATTCQTVKAALNRGTYHDSTATTPQTFATRGWTCALQSATSGEFECSKSKARFSFIHSIL